MNIPEAQLMAMHAVREACQLCRRVSESLAGADALDKKDKSPVTVADFGAQAVISERLARAFPDIPLVGEEDASTLREPGQADIRGRVVNQVQSNLPDMNEESILAAIDRGVHEGGAQGMHWTLDPIDGTKGFLRGDQYAVALALIDRGEVILGVLGCPNLPLSAEVDDGETGCLFVAARGEGANIHALDRTFTAPVVVSEVSRLSEASFCESVESGHTSHGKAEQIAERLGVTRPPFRIDSQCKYAAIARGDASIYLRLPTRADYQEKIWDHAAGYRVVCEAGGTVSDTRGRPLDFSLGRTLRNNLGVVATNGRFHEEVITAVRAVLETE